MIAYDVTQNASRTGYLGQGGEEVVVIGRFLFHNDETVSERTGAFVDPVYDDITTLEHFFLRVIGMRGTLGCRLVEDDFIPDAVDELD